MSIQLTTDQPRPGERSPEAPTPPKRRMEIIYNSVELAERAVLSGRDAVPEIAQRVLGLYRSQAPAQAVVQQEVSSVQPIVEAPAQPPKPITEKTVAEPFIDLSQKLDGIDEEYLQQLSARVDKNAMTAEEITNDFQQANR